MNFIIILILITVTCIAIRKTLKERKVEKETMRQEQREDFRQMVRDLYRK